MRKVRKSRRWLAVLLALSMSLGLTPAVLAEEPAPELTGLNVKLKEEPPALVTTGEEIALEVEVTPVPEGASTEGVDIHWVSDTPDVISVAGKTGESITVKPGKAGTATIEVYAEYPTFGGPITSKKASCTIEVEQAMGAIKINTSSVKMEPGGVQQITANRDPDNAVAEWESSDPSVVTVQRADSLGKTAYLNAIGPGEAEVTATIKGRKPDNKRSATLKVEVSGMKWEDGFDPDIIIPEGGSKSIPLDRLGRYGTANNSQAVIWQSSDPNIAEVASGTVAGRGPGRTTIVGFAGGYEISFNVEVTSDAGTTIELGSMGTGDVLDFSSLTSHFNKLAGGKLYYITNVSVPTNQGTLYYNYTSDSQPGAGVAQSGSYYRNPSQEQRGLEDITFVPNRNFNGGKVTISFTAVSDTFRNYSSRIIITVNRDTTPVSSLTTPYNTPLRLSASQFNQVCNQETGASLSYVTFSLPPEREGTLYTNYVGEGNYGSRVALNTRYGMKDLDNIAFVPAPGYTGTVVIYYTGYSTSGGKYFTGQLTITVERENSGGVAIGGVPYNTAQGGAVTFRDEDFDDYCSKLLGGQVLNYIRFTALPSASEGTLYYDYRGSTGTTVNTDTVYYFGTYTPRIDRLTFVPAENYRGIVRIPFTGWSGKGVQFSGNVEINVRGGTGEGDIHYTCAPGRTKYFSNSDFSELCRQLTGLTLDYIQFEELPRSSDGSLYYNNSRITSTGTRYYNNSGNRINNLSFRASNSFSGTLDIPFTGRARNGDSFRGVITISSSGGGSSGSTDRVIRYRTDYGSAAVFNRDDFDDLSQWETDRNVSSVRFSLPGSNQGDLYRGYRSSSNQGTRITSSGTSIAASELDRVAFIPKSGYTGTVYLDFTARSNNNDEFQGTVEIAVDRASADVTVRYSTRISPVNFRGDDFKRNSGSLSSIQFGAMPASSQGYIYYQYTSPTRYGRQASSGTAYRTSGSNLISDLTFVPRAGYSGTVTIPYTGSNSSGSTFEGELVITVTPSTSSAYFNDMGAYSDAQRAAVDYLRENGITNGISNTQYGPEHSITRADFAVMVYKAFGLTSTGGYVYFNDVPPNAYYAQAVNTLRAMGIVSGIGNGAYGSNYTLTRQDAICMVQRAMRAVGWSANDGLSSYLYGYSDGYDVSNYAQGAMAHAVQMGYLPISNGRLAPKNPLTRVDMAQIIHRVLTY